MTFVRRTNGARCDHASVAALEDRLRKYTIVAPFAGFVSAEHTEAGAWIQQGDPKPSVAFPHEPPVGVGEDEASRVDGGKVTFRHHSGHVLAMTVEG